MEKICFHKNGYNFYVFPTTTGINSLGVHKFVCALVIADVLADSIS